jgi:hypothetical protein
MGSAIPFYCRTKRTKEACQIVLRMTYQDFVINFKDKIEKMDAQIVFLSQLSQGQFMLERLMCAKSRAVYCSIITIVNHLLTPYHMLMWGGRHIKLVNYYLYHRKSNKTLCVSPQYIKRRMLCAS